MMILLHDPNNEASREFLSRWADFGPVIADHAQAVAACPALTGYPTVLYVDAQGQTHALFAPASMAEVETWRTAIDNPPPAARPSVLTPYEFASRFTLDETAAILALTKTDTMAEAIQKRFDVAQAIDLSYPEVAQGLAYFASKGALTLARAEQIGKP